MTSGTMYVEATVNGVPKSKSIEVALVQPDDSCPPADSGGPDDRMRDTAFVNELLRQVKAARNSDRIERGGDVGVHADGRRVLRSIPSLRPSPCEYRPDLSAAPAFPLGFQPDSAEWHVHTYKPGQRVFDCQNEHVQEGRTGAMPAGPSTRDWQSAYLNHKTGYMIDANEDLWRWNYPPNNGTNDSESFQVTKFRRKRDSSCYVRDPSV